MIETDTDTLRLRPSLRPCNDCGKPISGHAEACPFCGCFMQRFETNIAVNRKGWSGTIAGGVLLAFMIASVIYTGLIFLFWVLIFASFAASFNQNINR